LVPRGGGKKKIFFFFGKDVTATKVTNPRNYHELEYWQTVFSTLETNDDGSTWIRPKPFVSVRGLQEQCTYNHVIL
jgi:hypothetical protein